jgi:predicted nucleic acid-binding protein
VTVTVVVDASFVMASLSNESDTVRTWANEVIRNSDLVAPHVMPVEVTSALRIAERRELMTHEHATRAHQDLVGLDVELYPFEPFALRVWALRQAVSPYDAWYVALAERLGAPLATLDRRLARAADPRCEFTVPPT